MVPRQEIRASRTGNLEFPCQPYVRFTFDDTAFTSDDTSKAHVDNRSLTGIIAANLSNGVCRLASEQIHHASRRSTLGGYFHSLKNNPCVFRYLRYSSPVRADPAKQNFYCCVFK
jgi:hypothetical protein